MADNSIFFKIGSVFSGEGFQKASKAVKETSGEVKKGVSAAQQMAGAFSELDQSASKSMNAMTGMLQAVLSFNAATIITQATMTAINLILGEMKEKSEALTKRMTELKTEVDKAFGDALSTRVANIKNEISNMASEFDSVTKQALAFTAALEGVWAASASGGIAQLQVEKLQAMLDAHTDAERKNVEAAYDMQIAQAKLTEAEQSSAQKIEAAAEKYQASKDKIANIEEQMTTLANERANLEEAMLNAKASGTEKWTEIQTKVNELKQQEATLLQKYNEAINQSDIEALNLKKAHEEQTTAVANATAAVKQLELSQQMAAEEMEKKKYAEEKARLATEEKESAELLDAQELKTAAELQKSANDSLKNLEKAQNDFAAKLEEYNAKLLIPESIKDYIDKGGKGGLLPVDVQKSIQTKVADDTVDEAIRNGMVNTVKDADKLQRQVMRNVRDQITKEQKQQLAEAKKADRIRQTGLKARSEADKKFLAKYEAIEKAQKEAKEKVEAAKEAVEKAKTEQEKTAAEAKNIAQELNKAVTNGTQMLQGISNLTSKVNLGGIENGIKNQTDTLKQCLTVQ